MTRAFAVLQRCAEIFLGVLMGLMFLTFIIQITIRYTARLAWVAETLPFLNPEHYGWTLEFCLLLWIWIIFAGCAFIVQRDDHVTFDLAYDAVNPAVRRWFVIIGSIIIAVALAASIEPTWGKFYILRLKKTATLSGLFGDWIRMRDIYVVYILFLIAASLRFAWAAWTALRQRPDTPNH